MRILPLIIAAALVAAALPALRGEDQFTIAVIPDTQQEVLRANDTRFVNRIQYLLANRAAMNIKLMAQVGDLVNWDTVDHIQYQRASAGLKLLDDARLPYVLTIGNHDTAATKEGGSAAPGNVHDNNRNTSTFNSFFPIARHQIVRGVWESGKIDNAYHTLAMGDRDWLIVNIELWPRAGAVSWLKTVLAAHPNHNAIIVTHNFLTSGSAIEGGNGGYGDNSPRYLFDQAIKQYANVRMVYCGHVGTHGYRVDTGVHGNKIHSYLQNYATNEYNHVRLLEINTRNGTISSRIHIPNTNTTLADSSRFTVSGVSFVPRAGVTPVAPAITTQPTSLGVQAGQTATFRVAASGTPAPGYQWQRNGIDISGATGTSYTTPPTTSADNGATFRCVARNSAGSATSGSATLTVSGGAMVGNGTGLAGTYWNEQDFSGASNQRLDPRIDFAWAPTASPIAGIAPVGYSVRWRGQVQAQRSETYTFHTTADDGVRLWVNGRLLVDQWRDQGASEGSGAIALSAGAKVDIAIDYYQAAGDTRLALAWSSPSTPRQVVPTSQLYPGAIGGTGTGLAAVYFDNADLTGTPMPRTDATVNFTWSSGASPIAGIAADTWSARWAGQVQAPVSQTYTMSVIADDGVRLWVDGRLLIDRWIGQSPTEYSATIALTAGVKYDILLEYYNGAVSGRMALSWAGPSLARQVIPANRLFPAAMAAPWTARELGTAAAGSSYVADDTLVVTGSGADIWDGADGGRFVSQPLHGDGTIIARVVGMQDTNNWAKAGVMIREGTAAGARHAFCCVTPASGVEFQRRTTTNGGSTGTGGSASAAPRWVRLVRSGSLITASESSNGTTWTTIGSMTMSLANPVQIGVAVTSHDNTRRCTAVFDQVQVIPHGSG